MTSSPTTAALAHPTYSPRRRWGGLAVLAASLLVVVMDMTILNVALPDLTADLRPGTVAQLWIVDVYSLALAAFLVPFAAVGDRFGRRRMLLGGFTTFGVASLLVLVADSPGEVIAVRTLLGAGGAMIMPSTLSLIRTLFENPRERATALGVWGATASVGGALGPVVGGALLERFSWHAAFLVNVPVMVVAVVAGVLVLPESRSARPGRLDATGVILSGGGMATLVYGIKELGKDGPEPIALATLALGITLLALFVRRCLHDDRPMLAVRLFRGRAFTAGVITAMVTSVVLAAMLLLAAQWLQLVQGWSPLQSGVALLPLAVGGLVGSPLAPSLADRIGARAVLTGGLVVGGLGLTVMAWAPGDLGYGTLAVTLGLLGVGTASLALGSAVIMAGAPPSEAGSAAVIEETAYDVGAVLGVAVLGSLAAAIYRSGLPGDATSAARESLAGALASGAIDDPRVAMDAFSDSLAFGGLIGGLVLLVVAVAVWRLTPADLDLADSEH